MHCLSNKHQWAYKKGHSTELLLVKMTEDWRKALDNKLVVGIVFIDFPFPIPTPEKATECKYIR